MWRDAHQHHNAATTQVVLLALGCALSWNNTLAIATHLRVATLRRQCPPTCCGGWFATGGDPHGIAPSTWLMCKSALANTGGCHLDQVAKCHVTRDMVEGNTNNWRSGGLSTCELHGIHMVHMTANACKRTTQVLARHGTHTHVMFAS